MNRLSLGILLTFGLAVHVNGQSDPQINTSSIGYLYDRPVNRLEFPLTEEAETPTDRAAEEEEVEEEIITVKEDEDEESEETEEEDPKKLPEEEEEEDVSEREETVESKDGVEAKYRKREFKNGKSNIHLKRKNNFRRSHSRPSGDKYKRKPATGSKQKKIRQT